MVEERTQSFEQQLTEFDERITTERTTFDQLATQHTEAFNEAETKRGTAFQGEIATARQKLSGFQEAAQTEIDSHVEEIRRLEKDMAGMVGAAGLAGTAKNFGDEADDQRTPANRYRWATIVIAFLAVAMAVFATADEDQSTEGFIAKLVVSAALGGIAAYCARQSARHRRREEQSRQLQLELSAFAPFVEPLTREQQEEERVRMTRKTFGRAVGRGETEEELGPGAISFLLRRRQKELEEGDTEEG